MNTSTEKYEIKCDDCKTTIGRTDSVARSAQGGKCDDCKPSTKRGTTVANSTTQNFPNDPKQWSDDERVEYARVKIAEAIVRLIAEGRTYDQATAIAFAEVNRKWPNLLAAMLARVERNGSV
jgi:hypothetical protein